MNKKILLGQEQCYISDRHFDVFSAKDLPGVLLEYPSRSLHGVELEQEFVFGRHQFDYPGISKYHFQLKKEKDGWKLTPLSGTNGIYLNYKRVRKTIDIQDMDVIHTALLEMVIFSDRLWIWLPQDWQEYCVIQGIQKEKDGDRKPSFPIPTQTVPLEAPVMITPSQSPHWFTSIGPSLMIVISSLASAGSLYMRSPEDISTVVSMLTTSMSMAVAFLAYGLVNRKIFSNRSKEDEAEKIQLYEQYLKEKQEEFVLQESMLKQKIDEEHNTLKRLDLSWKGTQKEENFFIPFALEKKLLANFALPSLRYDQKHQPGVSLLKQLENLCAYQECWWGIKQGEKIGIPYFSFPQANSFFALWCWLAYRPDRKFVWIGWEEEFKPMVLTHPACHYKNMLLVFKDTVSFREFMKDKKDVHWTIVSTEDADSNLDQCTWIVKGREKNNDSLLKWISIDIESQEIEEKCQQATLGFYRGDNTNGWPANLLAPLCKADEFRSSQANLEVVLGITENLTPLYWNLKTEGPHALIAGTTGSGKSEGLLLVLLQLALYNTAKQVQFLIADFKGGALIAQLRELPHFCGALTNLEHSEFSRLKEALDKELDRRQSLLQNFAQTHTNEVQDIETYNLFHPHEPISHLIVAVDEFAQMKTRFPEMMNQIQETARIGRSLGIHLILCTQKPAGIIDEQIWSNSRSRLCFGVHYAEDSRQVLGHERAIYLKQSGEFILQVSQEEQEKKGRALYVRDLLPSEFCFRAQDEQDNEETIASKILQICKKTKEKRNWVLAPYDLATSKDLDIYAFEDKVNTFEELRVHTIDKTWIGADEETLADILSIIASSFEGYCFSCGSIVLDNTQKIGIHNLWQIEMMTKRALLLVEASQEVFDQSMDQLLKQENVMVVIYSTAMKPSWSSWVYRMKQRIVSNLQDAESMYILLGKSKKNCPCWPKGWVVRKDQMIRIQFNEEKNSQVRYPRPILTLIENPLTPQMSSQYSHLGLIGFHESNYAPVYWNREKQLVIVCTSPNKIEIIFKLVELWQREDPMLSFGNVESNSIVTFIDISNSLTLLMDKEVQNFIACRDLLFVGSDYTEVQMYLKRKGRVEKGDFLYFSSEEIQSGWLAKFKEE